VRTLVLGFGNRDRSDDGVAFHVIEALRRRLGQPPLCEEAAEAGPGDVDVASVFVPQLAPEWLDLARGYDALILVDAHVSEQHGSLWSAPIEAECRLAPFTHAVGPGTFVALLEMVHGKRPSAWIVSIPGSCFDFGRDLSDESAALVVPAVEEILRLAGEHHVV
jgi:hydrogenase maturation protease